MERLFLNLLFSLLLLSLKKVLEQGTHLELLSRGGIYTKLVEKQVSKMANTLDNDGQRTKLQISIDDLFDEVIGKKEGDDSKTKTANKKVSKDKEEK